MQRCKTGDQPYSDASPYSECSLPTLMKSFETLNIVILSKARERERDKIDNGTQIPESKAGKERKKLVQI